MVNNCIKIFYAIIYIYTLYILHTKIFSDNLGSITNLFESTSMLILPSKSLLAVFSQSIISCFIPNKSKLLNNDTLIYRY